MPRDYGLAYFCKLCPAEMPFEQMEVHNRGIHSDLFEQRARARARNMRILITAGVGSFAVFFLGLFFPAAILGIRVPLWYVVVIFIAMFAGFLIPLFFLVKSTLTHFEDLGRILGPCVICSSMLGDRDLGAHFASLHPEELRYFRVALWMPRISQGGIPLYGLLAATFLSVLQLGLWVWVPLVVWVGLFVGWAVLAHRHWKKARGAWQVTHVLNPVPHQ